MNEELQKVLTGMLNKASEGMDSAKTFLEAEIPDVVTQLLLWHGVYNFIWAVCSVLSFITVAVLLKRIFNIVGKENFKATSNGGSDPSFDFLKILVMGCISLGFFITGCQIFNITWLQIWLAPKIFIIEYIASLAK